MRSTGVGRVPGKRFDGRTGSDGHTRRWQDSSTELGEKSRHARDGHVYSSTQQSHRARRLPCHGTNELVMISPARLVAFRSVPCVSPNTRASVEVACTRSVIIFGNFLLPPTCSPPTLSGSYVCQPKVVCLLVVKYILLVVVSADARRQLLVT